MFSLLALVEEYVWASHWPGERFHAVRISAHSNIRMEMLLLLSTLIQRFVLSVPEGCKLPSGQLSGDALLVQPEQYSLVLSRRKQVCNAQANNALQKSQENFVLTRRTEVLEDAGHPCSPESAELYPELTQMTASSFCRKTSKNEKGI